MSAGRGGRDALSKGRVLFPLSDWEGDVFHTLYKYKRIAADGDHDTGGDIRVFVLVF